MVEPGLHDLVDRIAGRLVGAVTPDPNLRIVDAGHDARHVQPGWLYCCVPGSRADGHDFAPAAAAAGAIALLVERRLELDVPQILVESTRAAMGPAAALIHGDPSNDLTVIGVTGTNGKSSMVQLLSDIHSRAGQRTEIIGTISGVRTTPEATDLQRLLATARDTGKSVVAMEVSSHALSMGRVKGTQFASTVFTNLGRDHLDFHHTVEDYFLSKALLFTEGYSRHHVINIDDSYGRRLLDLAQGDVETYSMADVDELRYVGPTSHFRWRGRHVALPLAGDHNVSNAVGAATCAMANGVSIDDVVAALEQTVPVRGRFEMVAGSQPFHVAIDYAHTPDAMEAALTAARRVAGPNRVLVVFGCGGDRDSLKRPEMGRVAQRGADVVIVTSDNPRSEEPGAIVDAILAGIDTKNDVTIELDRRAAIGLAIAGADPGDIVLIAGKGHETQQIIGDQILDFDDAKVACEFLGAAKRGTSEAPA